MTSRESVLATELPEFSIAAERAQLQFFASVIGELDPIYFDPAAAVAAGHRDLLVPPTFLFSLELKRPEPYRVLDVIGATLSQALHGEQSFVYHDLVYAGDVLRFMPKVVDYYVKKDGALQFIVRRTTVTRAGDLVAELENTLILRSEKSP